MYFKHNYAFLSNMYPCTITTSIGDSVYTFSCVESAYQAHKCPERVQEFINLNGYEAKRLAKTVKLRSDWEDIKVDLMEKLVSQKFQDQSLKEKLQAVTGEIVETNNWGDRFWGRCYGRGLNVLGSILMKIRDNIS